MIFAACNDYKKRVTGLCQAQTSDEVRAILRMRATDKRRIVQMPVNRDGWTLNSATAFIYPEYD